MAYLGGSGEGLQMPDYRLGRLKGQFVVVWEEGGRRRRYRLAAKSPIEARSTLREFVKARERADGPQRLTVGDRWNAYIEEKRAAGKVSVARMEDAWKRLAPAFGTLAPDSISPGLVRGYIYSRHKQGVGDGTIHTELGYLRAALRYSLKGGAPHITLPPKPRPRTRHLTTDEAKRLIDAATMPHVRLFIILALHTAGRPSSILDLTWDRVDFGKRTIQLDNPGRDRTAKGRATVPLACVLQEPLESAKRAALTHHVIEWGGRPVRSIKKAIRRASDRALLEDVSPYVLRHTACVWMAEAGVPMVEIAQYCGHTSPNITYKTYARFSPDYLRKASDAISKRLAGT